MDGFQPRDPDRRRTWARLSSVARQARLSKARRKLAAIEEVRARTEGETERAAITRVVTWAHRSSYRRWQDAFDAEGFDGLLDWRMAPKSPMPSIVVEAICTLRRADPNCPVADIVVHVAKHHGFETSEAKVKRVLKSAGLQRRPGPAIAENLDQPGRLELGGMRLVESPATKA